MATLAVVLFAGVLAVNASPASAATQQATILSPVDGTISSAPGTHHRVYTWYGVQGDWSEDIHTSGQQRPVYARFSESNGPLSLRVGSIGQACSSGGGGLAVLVLVTISGVEVGGVWYSHLANLAVSNGQAVANGARLGDTAVGLNSDARCWTGPHVHLEAINKSRYSCFTPLAEGQGVNGGSRLGVIGGEWASGVNQSCPAHAYYSGGGSTLPTAQTGSSGSNLRTGATTQSSILTTIPGGTTITLECWVRGEAVQGQTGAYDLWHRTSYGGQTGYVSDQTLNTPAYPDPSANQPRPGEPACPTPTTTTTTTTTTTSTTTTTAPADQARSLQRVAGGDRYETSAALSRRVFGGGAPLAFIASGEGFADALAGGTIDSAPILLVPRCAGVPSAVRDEIERLNPSEVARLGGESSVCSTTHLAAAAGRRTSELSGASRYETAVEISKWRFPQGSTSVYLARGDNFADALSGGTLQDGPILLVPQCGPVPDAVAAEVDRLQPTSVVALGGPNAVCDSVLERLAGTRAASRIAGADRYGTSALISQRKFAAHVPQVYLASGTTAADALAANAIADGPVLLVPACGSLPIAVAEEIRRLDPDSITVLGGTAAVCQPIAESAAAA